MYAFRSSLQAKPYTSNIEMLNFFLQTFLKEYSKRRVPILDH